MEDTGEEDCEIEKYQWSSVLYNHHDLRKSKAYYNGSIVLALFDPRNQKSFDRRFIPLAEIIRVNRKAHSSGLKIEDFLWPDTLETTSEQAQ
ncbi:hypothetical protein Leryth_002546 [Lithospermum erythrorhizon]|nr:hypothetical protein Leryth_002546 [Lithospermum erythrorhizon]